MQVGPEEAMEADVSHHSREPERFRSRPRPTSVNRSVARALRLLLDVAGGANSLSFAEFQARHKLPKATLHKLLATLESMSFLRRDAATGKYSVGVAALEFSAGYAAGPDDLPSILAPIMQRLVNDWKETIHLGVIYGGEEVMLQRLDPPNQIVRIGAIIAHRHPAYATAGGLAALAVTPDKSFLDALPEELPPRTKNTVKTRAELLARLEEIRERGYSLDLEDAYLGVRCVGVAVAVPRWPVVHVSFTLPLQRAPIERLRALAKPLMAAAKEIEKILLVTTPRA
jgi:IclR family acetate operon transcriptional repressor